MIYLASPYSHPQAEVRAERYRAVLKHTHILMLRHLSPVYSPIVHNHPIATEFDLPRDWEFWKAFDVPMVRRADRLVVLCLDGWRDSVGVKAEITAAHTVLIPVTYHNPE